MPDFDHKPVHNLSTGERLLLASKSASRRAMLAAAGVAHDAQPAAVDERAIEASLHRSRLQAASPAEIALALAQAKAQHVSRENTERLVLGSDSLVVVAGRRFDKPASLAEAAEHLRFFSGKVIELHSAAALARGGLCIWTYHDLAQLRVRELSEAFITAYLAAEWPEVSHCVGVFRMEAMGVQLFEAVSGSHFTVLGMPLLPVLGALREQGVLAA